jgi:hypothetical protein
LKEHPPEIKAPYKTQPSIPALPELFGIKKRFKLQPQNLSLAATLLIRGCLS